MGDFFDRLSNQVGGIWYRGLAKLEGVNVVPGKGANSAIALNAGHIFSSPDQIWAAAAQMSVMGVGGETGNGPSGFGPEQKAAAKARVMKFPDVLKVVGPAAFRGQNESEEDWWTRIMGLYDKMNQNPAQSGPPPGGGAMGGRSYDPVDKIWIDRLDSKVYT